MDDSETSEDSSSIFFGFFPEESLLVLFQDGQRIKLSYIGDTLCDPFSKHLKKTFIIFAGTFNVRRNSFLTHSALCM